MYGCSSERHSHKTYCCDDNLIIILKRPCSLHRYHGNHHKPLPKTFQRCLQISPVASSCIPLAQCSRNKRMVEPCYSSSCHCARRSLQDAEIPVGRKCVAREVSPKCERSSYLNQDFKEYQSCRYMHARNGNFQRCECASKVNQNFTNCTINLSALLLPQLCCHVPVITQNFLRCKIGAERCNFSHQPQNRHLAHIDVSTSPGQKKVVKYVSKEQLCHNCYKTKIPFNCLHRKFIVAKSLTSEEATNVKHTVNTSCESKQCSRNGSIWRNDTMTPSHCTKPKEKMHYSQNNLQDEYRRTLPTSGKIQGDPNSLGGMKTTNQRNMSNNDRTEKRIRSTIPKEAIKHPKNQSTNKFSSKHSNQSSTESNFETGNSSKSTYKSTIGGISHTQISANSKKSSTGERSGTKYDSINESRTGGNLTHFANSSKSTSNTTNGGISHTKISTSSKKSNTGKHFKESVNDSKTKNLTHSASSRKSTSKSTNGGNHTKTSSNGKIFNNGGRNDSRYTSGRSSRTPKFKSINSSRVESSEDPDIEDSQASNSEDFLPEWEEPEHEPSIPYDSRS